MMEFCPEGSLKGQRQVVGSVHEHFDQIIFRLIIFRHNSPLILSSRRVTCDKRIARNEIPNTLRRFN
jgi:hypothetical protein